MTKKIAIGAVVVLSLILIIVGCSPPAASTVPAQKPAQTPQSTPTPAVISTSPPPPTSTSKPSGPVKEKWLEPQVSGDTVRIPVIDIKNNWNTAFKIVDKGTTLNFMAYVLNGEIQVRANVCPPCRSIGYTLDGDILICDTCKTTFRATNGMGIQGACVNYPKAAVQYKIVDNNIVMNVNDLVNAYQETLKPG